MSKTFTVKVRGKIAAAEYTEPYVCDNSDYEIEFDFSEEWQVYELKTARFAYGGKMQDIIFEGSRCGVPRMSGICSFKVGVFAGDLSTTTPAYIEARASILSEGGTPAAPAPDVYDQLMQRMNEIEAPNWNQNDETKKDYIKGRTHYTYKERKTLYENNAISSSPIKLNDNPFSLEVGKTYIVEFDGIEYEIICKSYNGRFAYIGNLYFSTHKANLDSGEPFYIDDMLIYAELGSGTHSILLMQNVEAVHTLDPKYLPEYNVEGYEFDKIVELLESGAKCYVIDEFGRKLYYAGTKPSSSSASLNIVFAGVVTGYYATVEYSLPNWTLVRKQAIPLCESVRYTPQTLTNEQKAQARANINADRFEVEIYRDRGTPYSDKTAKEIYDAFASGKTVEIAVDLVRAMLTECRMQNDKYYISCYVPRVTEAYTVAGLGSYMLYLDGVLGTARGMWKEGLYNVTATAELAPITGIVTADKLTSPDHPTDLVAYEAFMAAVPLVQSMDITGAQVGQTIKVKAVNKQGMPTAWEVADMSADEQWELLGTLDASTGDVLQLDFSNPVKKLYFYSSLCDTAGEQYSASTTVYRQVAFKVGDTWRDVNSFKIGCCKHNWCWKTRYWLECGANLPYPKGEWTETLSAGNVAIKLTPLEIGNNNQYSSGLVSGIRFSLVLPDGTENTASGTIKVWGVKA